MNNFRWKILFLDNFEKNSYNSKTKRSSLMIFVGSIILHRLLSCKKLYKKATNIFNIISLIFRESLFWLTLYVNQTVLEVTSTCNVYKNVVSTFSFLCSALFRTHRNTSWNRFATRRKIFILRHVVFSNHFMLLYWPWKRSLKLTTWLNGRWHY